MKAMNSRGIDQPLACAASKDSVYTQQVYEGERHEQCRR